MLWKKPDNKSWTEICKEFDKEFYEEDRDDTKLFQYMYAIYYMLACKAKSFEGPDSFRKYDEFAYFAARTVYMRYMKKQKEGEKIKSILNYAKGTRQFLKIMWQNEDYAKIYNPEVDEDLDMSAFKESMVDSIQSDYNQGMDFEVEQELANIVDIIKDVVNDTPYKRDKIMSKRIYKSCLLSFLNSITLSNNYKTRGAKKSKDAPNDDTILKELQKERENEVILWHLNDSMKDYIKILNTKVRNKLVEDIVDTKSFYEIPSETMDAIIASGYATYDCVNMEDE